jgi:sporulation-control protein spo0M
VLAFDDIKPGARLRGLDPSGVAEVVQIARFGADALNLVFRVDGRVARGTDGLVSMSGDRNQDRHR